MAKKALEVLTESMYYILMAFLHKEMCGKDVVDFINNKTNGRIKIGPGTLYTILAKFEEGEFIKEISIKGRKRTYEITNKGKEIFEKELERYKLCVLDAESEEVNEVS